MAKETVELALSAESSRVECRLTCSSGVRKAFLDDRFPIEYDVPIDGVDASLLAIPAVALVAPIAWLFGADVHVATLDTRYREALTAVRAVVQGFYPWFRGADSHLVVERPVANPSPPTGRVGQLFTAGVDSMTTYLRHQAERPELFAIWETPHYHDWEWRRRRRHLQRFAAAEALPIHFITPNLDVLNRQYLRLHSTIDWWPEVSHGLILTGLCAPITALRGISTLYIASSMNQGRIPYGSHPQLDNQLRWAGTRVAHDGAELYKIAKMRYLSRFARYLPYLVVYHHGLPNKTAHTCTVLMLLGIDPHRCTTFDEDIEGAIHATQAALVARTYPMSAERRRYWLHMQQLIPARLPAFLTNAMRDYLTWVQGFDFTTYSRRADRAASQWRLRLQSFLNVHAPRVAYAFRRARARLRTSER